MPYYRWRGVDITGQTKKGVLFARCPEHLDALLIKRQVALIKSKEKRQWIPKSIRLKDKVHFFRQLSVLIDSGILVPDALAIVGDQLAHPQFQEIVHLVAIQVQEGETLSSALEQYPNVFNQITIQLIRAGEESGRMAQAFDAISGHIAATQDFYTRLRSMLLLPTITFMFFLAIVTIIFVVIMPRFIDIFASMQQEIPPLTKHLLAVSEFMRSPWMGVIIALFSLAMISLWRVTRWGKGRRMLDWFLIHLPIIGPILQQRFLAYTMQALAVLLDGGMPLVQALMVVRESIDNQIFRDQLLYLEADVSSGSSLSDAMMRHQAEIFTQDVIAMVEVGQESGRLATLLLKVGNAYYDRVSQQLSWLTVLLQPIIMILLGLLVAVLIFAVYGPIFTMSSAF